MNDKSIDLSISLAKKAAKAAEMAAKKAAKATKETVVPAVTGGADKKEKKKEKKVEEIDFVETPKGQKKGVIFFNILYAQLEYIICCIQISRYRWHLDITQRMSRQPGMTGGRNKISLNLDSSRMVQSEMRECL